MSRLYYDEPTNRPGAMTWPKIRWNRPAAFNIEEGKEETTVKSYLEKVAKLVPSEVIAGYLTLIGFVSAIKSQNLHVLFYIVIFLLCIILTPIYLNFQADAYKPVVSRERPSLYVSIR